MIHNCSVLLAPRSIARCGNASNMTNVSSETSRVGRASTARAVHCRRPARADAVASLSLKYSPVTDVRVVFGRPDGDDAPAECEAFILVLLRSAGLYRGFA